MQDTKNDTLTIISGKTSTYSQKFGLEILSVWTRYTSVTSQKYDIHILQTWEWDINIVCTSVNVLSYDVTQHLRWSQILPASTSRHDYSWNARIAREEMLVIFNVPKLIADICYCAICSIYSLNKQNSDDVTFWKTQAQIFSTWFRIIRTCNAVLVSCIVTHEKETLHCASSRKGPHLLV